MPDPDAGSPSTPSAAAEPPNGASDRPPSSDSDAATIVRAWLEGLPSRPDRPPPLVDAYGALAHLLIQRAREGGPTPSGPCDDRAEQERRHRTLTRVAAAARRHGVGTRAVVRDLYRLVPVLLRPPPASPSPFLPDETVADLVAAATDDVARILERTRERESSEHALTVASLTEMLVHELENRLAAAETASLMLRSPSLPIEEAWLERISELLRDSVGAALRTIEDVRSLVASGAELDDPVPRPVSLPALTRQVLRGLRAEAEAAGVELRVHDDLPDVEVDASRMRLILSNLVGNGIKYRRESVERPWVEVGGGLEVDGTVVVRVRDNGRGIASQDLNDIFEYRFRSEEDRSIRGEGLGLSIVREAAEQLDATVEVSSEPGWGSEFRVSVRPTYGDGEGVREPDPRG